LQPFRPEQKEQRSSSFWLYACLPGNNEPLLTLSFLSGLGFRRGSLMLCIRLSFCESLRSLMHLGLSEVGYFKDYHSPYRRRSPRIYQLASVSPHPAIWYVLALMCSARSVTLLGIATLGNTIGVILVIVCLLIFTSLFKRALEQIPRLPYELFPVTGGATGPLVRFTLSARRESRN
jgi:hypothetical protein